MCIGFVEKPLSLSFPRTFIGNMVLCFDSIKNKNKSPIETLGDDKI